MKKNKYKLLIAGDLLPNGNNVKLFEAGDSLKIFGEKVCQLFLDADFSIVNLEGALTNSECKQKKVDPVLKAPIATINGIKNLGIKAVALANNHITDYCDEGYDDTIKTLEKAGILHVGSGYDLKSIKKHLSICLGQIRVCIYNVSETFFNVAGEHSAGCNLYDEWLVLNEIRELKKTHDFLIVIYHGGAEEFPYPTPMVKKRFHRMSDCGADFITAQHTHCIGCEELHNKAYLLYGQGNFLFSRMKSPITKQGLITEIIISDDINDSAEYKHHFVRVSGQEIMHYDEKQDLAAFYSRSKEIGNEDEIRARYQQFAYNNVKIKNRYLMACRGNGLIEKVCSKLPHSFNNKHLEKYSQQQLLRMLISHSGERYSEDTIACLTYMIN